MTRVEKKYWKNIYATAIIKEGSSTFLNLADDNRKNPPTVKTHLLSFKPQKRKALQAPYSVQKKLLLAIIIHCIN